MNYEMNYENYNPLTRDFRNEIEINCYLQGFTYWDFLRIIVSPELEYEML